MSDLLEFPTDGTLHSGLLSSVRTSGPDIVSGGAFGQEGGLACTVVLLISIGVLMARTRRSYLTSSR